MIRIRCQEVASLLFMVASLLITDAGYDLIVDSPMHSVIDIHRAGEFIAHGPLDDYGQ